MLRRLGLTGVLVLLSSGTALAGNGFYLGFHGGASGVDVAVGESRLRLESKDLAWKLFAGFGGRFLALETGYVNLGSAEDTVADVALRQDLWGWDTAGLVKINLGPVDLYGRVGGTFWKADVSIGDSGLSLTDDGFDWNYGGGIGVNLGQLGIRGEMVWYNASSIGDPWMASIGVTLSF
jgi:hypothetical protein